MQRLHASSAFLATLAILATAPFLTGCPAAAVMVVQAVPGVIGLGAVAGSENRSPFHHRMPDSYARPRDEMAQLDATIQRAECGDPESQFRLATTLRNGMNTAPNNIEIYKWYRLAQDGGYVAAGDELANLETTMSGTDVARARALASDWRPSAEGCTTQS
jgi:hypothetical protein